LRLPENAVLLEPGGSVLDGVGVETAAVNAAIDFTPQQTGGFEHAEMLGDGRERDVERFGEFADSRFALQKARKYGAAGGVGEGAERAVQSGVGIVNHMV
jgi:hypothetical protein